MSLPSFLVKKVPKQQNIRRLRGLLGANSLHTVCESASCPNIGECFSQNTLTFLILGNTCTRHCAFCGINKGDPLPPNPDEPGQIAEAARKLGLDYVVITSVTRDDLPDGGSQHFASVIAAVRRLLPAAQVEVLIPDFSGSDSSLRTVLDAGPTVLNHNIETVPRLYPAIRPEADFARSKNLLVQAKKIRPQVVTKSGFMVGLGEREEEVVETLKQLAAGQVDVVTIGQYLPPSRESLKPARYVPPEEFDKYRILGESFGLSAVLSGPFVRSSYHAKEVLKTSEKV